MGVELQASEGSHTRGDMKVLYVTLLLGALLATAECKRRGGGGKPKKARSARGGERSRHIAGEGGEESCGNSTEIFTTETPSSLCTEVGNNFCICATRGDLEKEEEEVTWKFTCGSCDLKWKPEREEEAAGEEEDLGGGKGAEEGDEEEDEAEAEGEGGEAGEDEEEEAEPQSLYGRGG